MSSDISSRGFISGIIATAAAGKLVVEASDADVARFGKGTEVVVYNTTKDKYFVFDSAVPATPYELVFNAKGQPLGVVESATYHTPVDAFTTLDLRLRVDGHVWTPSHVVGD